MGETHSLLSNNERRVLQTHAFAFVVIGEHGIDHGIHTLHLLQNHTWHLMVQNVTAFHRIGKRLMHRAHCLRAFEMQWANK